MRDDRVYGHHDEPRDPWAALMARRPAWYREMTTPWGVMAYNIHDVYVGQALAVYGEYSPVERRFLEQLLRPGDVVVEVGANIGALTLPMAHAVAPSGLVIAFEPQRAVHEVLSMTLAVNASQRAFIDLRLQAVGAAPGTATIARLPMDGLNNFGGVSLNSGGEGVDAVPVVTIDSLNLPALRLLKADCEGMEAEVIAGATETIRRCRPILYLEDDRADRSEALHRAVLALGYRLALHKPPLFDPDNHRRVPFPTSQLGCHECNRYVVSRNLLGVPVEWDRQPWEPTG